MILRAASATVLVLAFGACSATGPPTSAPATSSQSVSASTASSISSPSRPIASSALAWDASLLEVLPPKLGDLTRTPEPDAFAELAADRGLATNVQSVAIAVYAGQASLVTASVARLRPDVFGEAFLRDWRDSYDMAACAAAGGVSGHAQAEIGGHTTYITSCGGEVRAYHVHLDRPALLVSLFAVGADRDRLGEQLVGELPSQPS